MVNNGVEYIGVAHSEIDNIKEVYTKVLGYSLIKEENIDSQGSKKLHIRKDNINKIVISYDNELDLLEDRQLSNLTYLAIEVGEINEAIKTLNNRGVETSKIITNIEKSKRQIFFEDDNGFIIEMYDHISA